jgi:hypothetical protein
MAFHITLPAVASRITPGEIVEKLRYVAIIEVFPPQHSDNLRASVDALVNAEVDAHDSLIVAVGSGAASQQFVQVTVNVIHVAGRFAVVCHGIAFRR